MEPSQGKTQHREIPKMKVFQHVQKNFATLGIDSDLMLQQYPINMKIFISYLLGLGSIISMLMFLFDEQKTFAEYTQAVYFGSFAVLIISALVILVLHVDKLFQFIKTLDVTINASKCTSNIIPLFEFTTSECVILALKYSASNEIFSEANRLEKKMSEIILFVIVKMTPACTMFSWCIYIYVIYFTTDLGPDAFVLPAQMM